MIFWKRTEENQTAPFLGKIEVFSRHCIFSLISQHKKRFPHFSRELCYQNLLATIDRGKTNLTFLLDLAKGSRENHFLKEAAIEIHEGSEAGSFLRLLDCVVERNFHPETILYFVEDDYLHRPGWIDILIEGFTVEGAEYVTLYDHRDKYFLPLYDDLTSHIFATQSSHWRTIPSTTQTFAVKVKTLMRDLKVHRHYSIGQTISRDHDKFCHLTKRGVRLISSIPGFSTHAEPEFASPCIDWESMFNPGDSYV